MYKGKFEDGVFLLVETVLTVERFLEINFEALHGLKVHFELLLKRECLKRTLYV